MRENSDYSTNQLEIHTDDRIDIPLVTTPLGQDFWRRGIAWGDFSTTWTFCFPTTGAGQAADTLWLDDIQFE